MMRSDHFDGVQQRFMVCLCVAVVAFAVFVFVVAVVAFVAAVVVVVIFGLLPVLATYL
jgi:hypothetical protein